MDAGIYILQARAGAAGIKQRQRVADAATTIFASLLPLNDHFLGLAGGASSWQTVVT